MRLSWAPHFLDRIDYTYTDRMPPPIESSQGRPSAHPQVRFKDGVLPSDFFHSNVFMGFQEDALGIRDRHIIGVTTCSGARIIPTQSRPSHGAARFSRTFWRTVPRRKRLRSSAATPKGYTAWIRI